VIADAGLKGYRVAQLKAVFHVPPAASAELFRDDKPAPQHLAYVEWFSAFPPDAMPHHNMYKISRSFNDGKQESSIIPVSAIRRTVHLYPKFGPITPGNWTFENVLEECMTFYVNPFVDRHAYITIY
jgi:hypothetical protein